MESVARRPISRNGPDIGSLIIRTSFILQYFLIPLLDIVIDSCNKTSMGIYGVLFFVFALICFFSAFTDSYLDNQGVLHYGIATPKGFWPFSSDAARNSSVDFTAYRIQLDDFVHAFLSVFMLAMLSLFDHRAVRCLYPSMEKSEWKFFIVALHPLLGIILSVTAFFFPLRRHSA